MKRITILFSILAVLLFAVAIKFSLDKYAGETPKTEFSQARPIQLNQGDSGGVYQVSHAERIRDIQSSIQSEQTVDIPVLKAQVTDATGESGGGFMDWLKLNSLALIWGLIAFVEVIVRLTPTDRDNSIFNIVKNILDAILPNRRASGGYHT
jgi:hypothetical protein